MKNISVLIVEDENIVAKDIAARVARQGYTVSAVVGTGEEAVQLAERIRPDLILMDIMLKGAMDGIEATQKIRERFDTPVVYLTAYADEKTLQRAKVTEAFGYLLKPFEERELHITIEMALYKHQMERKLREHEEWLETTLKSIGDAVISTDADGRIRFMNPKAEALTGWTQREGEGMPLGDVLTKGEGESVLLSKDGRPIPIEETQAPTMDASGVRSGSVVVFRDISDRKRLEEQLRQSQKMESIGTLASGIAHDFNNILNNVLGFAYQLQKHADDQARVQKYSQTIERSATRGAELCSQLLTFARAGRKERVATDLKGIIEEVVSLSAGTFPKSIRLHKAVEESVLPVLGDRGELYQILLNLIVNARDAVLARTDSQGGSVIIEAMNVAVEPETNPDLLGFQGEYCVALRVTDSGIGIPESIRDRIFDPFFTTKEKGQGTGLGLSVVYNIVRNHKGVLRVESEEGVGTTFAIYLPAVKGEVKQPQAASANVAASAGRETVLVVDDEVAMQELAKDVLEERGYRVLVAGSGEEALEVCRKHRNEIALAVLDLVMKGMDGVQTFHGLKEINPRLKTFFCTGYMPGEILKSLPEKERNQLLRKPFTPQALLEMVRGVLDLPAHG
jgi:signal transduction histidine kinase/DNA-binding response OmpR family regulator